jgi:hypothetical protein
MKQKRELKTGKKGRTRFPGIGADAKALGVNRVTLYRALTGRYRLNGLLRRYEHLKSQPQSHAHALN